MGGNYSRIHTRTTGNTVEGPDDDADFDNIIANSTPAGLDDASANVTAMRATTDPYPADSESLATSTEGELQRIRFLLDQLTATTQWYIFPDLVSKTAAYTATLDDRVILGDASGGAFSITLPTAVGNTDKIYYIKNIGASGAVTVDGDGTEEIDGATTQVLSLQYDSIVIVSDGVGWQILSGTFDIVTLAGAQTITGVKTFDNGLLTDTISEETADNGIAIDGVVCKDSYILAADSTSGIRESSVDWASAGGITQGCLMDREETHTGDTNWTTVFTTQIYVPDNANNLSVVARLKHSVGGGQTAGVRVKVGATTSTGQTTNSTTYISTAEDDLDISGETAGWNDIEVQVQTSAGAATVTAEAVRFRII